jgi:hypothetical protein
MKIPVGHTPRASSAETRSPRVRGWSALRPRHCHARFPGDYLGWLIVSLAQQEMESPGLGVVQRTRALPLGHGFDYL